MCIHTSVTMSRYSPDDYDNGTATLDICSKSVTCEKVIKILLENGVSATVSKTSTIMRNEKELWVEPGCHITIHGLKSSLFLEKLWKPLKCEFGLQCAYLEIPGQFMGCILNFIRPSICSCNGKKR